MTGFTAADMSTAAANGHRDGYQAGYADAVKAFEPAAAQEAVAWSEGYASGVIDERTSEANIGIAGFGEKVEPARANPYLLAAPVASAPVGDDGKPMVLVSQEFKDQAEYDARISSGASNLLRDNSLGLTGSLPAMVGELLKLASTPAAPGVDVNSILEIVAKYVGRTSSVYSYIAEDLEQIDASPKGG